jgi:hypothetical protein
VVIYSLLLVVDEKSHALYYRPSLAYVALAHPYYVLFVALAKYSDQEAFQPMDYATILAFYGQQTRASIHLQGVLRSLADFLDLFAQAKNRFPEVADLAGVESVSSLSLQTAYRKVPLPGQKVFPQFHNPKNLLPKHQ